MKYLTLLLNLLWLQCCILRYFITVQSIIKLTVDILVIRIVQTQHLYAQRMQIDLMWGKNGNRKKIVSLNLLIKLAKLTGYMILIRLSLALNLHSFERFTKKKLIEQVCLMIFHYTKNQSFK